jgi:hypothetical protein
MVKAMLFGFVSVLIFHVGWAWYFLAAPASRESVLKTGMDPPSRESRIRVF